MLVALVVFRDRFLVCSVARSVVVWGSESAIFDYLAAFENTVEWDPNTEKARRVTPARAQPTVGDSFEVTTLLHGRASLTTYQLTHVDRRSNVRLMLAGESDSAFLTDTITLHEEFALDGVERTRVDYKLDVRLKGRMAPLALLLRPVLEELATTSMDGLVRACARRFGSTVRGVQVADDGIGMPQGGAHMQGKKES